MLVKMVGDVFTLQIRGGGHHNCDKYSCMTSIRRWTDQMHARLLLLKFETCRQIMIRVQILEV